MLHKPTIDPGICPASATLAQNLTDIGWVLGCTLWTHHRPQNALSSVEWLMARVGDVGPAINRHWVECSLCWALCCRRVDPDTGPLSYPANTGYSDNAVLMLAHRL